MILFSNVLYHIHNFFGEKNQIFSGGKVDVHWISIGLRDGRIEERCRNIECKVKVLEGGEEGLDCHLLRIHWHPQILYSHQLVKIHTVSFPLCKDSLMTLRRFCSISRLQSIPKASKMEKIRD